MKQRVGIARALAMKPKVLLMDEPFGALDALTRAHLQDSVMQIQQALNTTIVMITHDVDEAVLLSDRVLMMTNGPAATVGRSSTSICRARAIACSWRTTAAITICASRSCISSMKNSRKRRRGGDEAATGDYRQWYGGHRLAQALVERDAQRFSITVIGDEPGRPITAFSCRRCWAVKKRRRDAAAASGIRGGVTVRAGETVTAVDIAAREVQTTAGELGWDELVFATGSLPFLPPLPGIMRRTFLLSALADVEGILASTARRWSRRRRARRRGGRGAARHGDSVTLLHRGSGLMEQQMMLCRRAAAELLAERGIRCVMESRIAAIDEHSVRLEDGRVLPPRGWCWRPACSRTNGWPSAAAGLRPRHRGGPPDGNRAAGRQRHRRVL
jgi:hypothetical protein